MTHEATTDGSPASAATPRTLFLVRHADAAAITGGGSDFDRTLTDVGERQAVAIASLLGSRPIDYVVCSSSNRTRGTVAPLLARLSAPLPTIAYDKRVYDAALSSLLRVIESIPPSSKMAVLVGHNPGMLEVLATLVGDPSPRNGFPKAAVAELSVPGDWSAIQTFRCQLVKFTEPA